MKEVFHWMHKWREYTAHIQKGLMNHETHFYFLSKTYTHLSTKFLFIIFTYEYTARKSDLQIFVYLVKYLVIFIVLISEKFKASFYLVVTFVELP